MKTFIPFTIAYSVEITQEEFNALLCKAKELGLDFDKANDKQLVKRLLMEYGKQQIDLIPSY